MNKRKIKAEIDSILNKPEVVEKLKASIAKAQKITETLRRQREIDSRCTCHKNQGCFWHTRFK